MIPRRAIIVGSDGQDGQLMNSLLLKKKYDIFNINRHNFDIHDSTSIKDLVKSYKPHEIYFFAASHKSSQDIVSNFSEDLIETLNVNTLSPNYFLDAILHHSQDTRFFYASSVLVYPAGKSIINEKSFMNPDNPYAISKYATMQSIKSYREKGVFALSGILSNHESKFRKDVFLSRKIIKKAVDAFYGDAEMLIIGDLNSYVDWGYAPDFIEIIHKIINSNKPSDFIIASGKLHQVRDFLEIAFKQVNLDYKKYVIEDNTLLKRSNGVREFDISKLKKMLNLDFMLSFEEMIKKLIDQEFQSR